MDLPIQGPSESNRSGGSVKRAREQAERQRLGLTSDSPPRMRQGPQVRGEPQRPRQPLPQAITASRTGQQGIGAAISRPTPAPQWPLASQTARPEMNDNSQQYQPPSGRGKAPPRPARPSHVPSILDASKVQDHTPSFPYNPKSGSSHPGSQSREAQQHLDEMRSPDVLSPVTPMTMQSRASTNSSVGTIPDFPVPVAGANNNHGATGLGPPPSSRRGPSSYYSMQSFVSPIPEESPKAATAHGSYASSTAIPSNWGEMGYGYETDQQALFDKEMDEGPEPEGEGIVRSASVGKRAKPSIIVTKNQQEKTPPQSRGGVLEKTKNLQDAGMIENGGRKPVPQRGNNAQPMQMPKAPFASQRDTTWPTFGPDSPTEGNKELGDLLSSSDSDSTLTSSPTGIQMEKLAPVAAVPAAAKLSNSRSPSVSPFEMGDKEIKYSRNSAIRRPPRLNMDAVRDAEARGSLTSLPDLIRRATRLASMMNEGKRPASRLNDLNDFPPPGLGEKGKPGNGRHRNTPSGISGMLAAFPPPGLATPVGTPKSGSRWPAYESSLRSLRTPGDDDGESRPRNGRRCCGMPICWFLILLIVLLLVIAAAIVVPLELLVLNKKPDSNANLSALQICEKDSACNNGGQSIINAGVCSCICVNNFTGTNCDDESSVGCTTVSFTANSQSYTDVTIGASIPSLIDGAAADYAIPLEFPKVLAKFSDADLSCDAQNAIVSFNPGTVESAGAASAVRSATPESKTSSAETTGPTSIVKGSGGARKRWVEAGMVAPRTEEAAPSASETPTKSSSTTKSTPTPTSKSSSSADAAANFTVTDDTLDFSRTAVLYILQTRSLDDAATAQTKITSFLVGGGYGGAANVTVGDGVSIDFLSWSVDSGSGVVGGKAEGGVRVGDKTAAGKGGNGKRGAKGEMEMKGLRGMERRLTGQRS